MMFALVDCNNFFVSCERVFRPELEGRPVVVLSNNDGCVVSRSNESKALGIKMCTPFYKIRHLADSGTLTVCSSNIELYRDMSGRVMSILADAVPRIEVYSVDEAYLRLDGMNDEAVYSLCRTVLEKVRKWVGIPVSIGVAPTKTLAKVAGRFAKIHKGYGGVCMMDTEEKRIRALELTPIEDVWGIGRRLAPQMSGWGISTALDFAGRPRGWVSGKLGVHGVRTWEELHGRVCIEAEKSERRKSICTSRSFAEMIEDEGELSRRVSDFAARCARKLREEHSAACDVTVFMQTNRFRCDLAQYSPYVTVRLDVPASSSAEIVGAALSGFRMIWRPGYGYKRAGVIVGNIVASDAVQPAMFGFDAGLRDKNDRLSKVMDAVNRSCRTSGRPLLHLAAQRSVESGEIMRCDYRSRRYSTLWDEIIEVK